MLVMSSNKRRKRPTGLFARYAAWLLRPNGRTGAPNYIGVVLLCIIGIAAALSMGWPALDALMHGALMNGMVEENTRRGTYMVPIYPTLLSSIGVAVLCILVLLSVLLAITTSGGNRGI